MDLPETGRPLIQTYASRDEEHTFGITHGPPFRRKSSEAFHSFLCRKAHVEYTCAVKRHHWYRLAMTSNCSEVYMRSARQLQLSQWVDQQSKASQLTTGLVSSRQRSCCTRVIRPTLYTNGLPPLGVPLPWDSA